MPPPKNSATGRSRHYRKKIRARPVTQIAVAVLLSLALVVGGGGREWPASELILHGLTGAVGAIWILKSSLRAFGSVPSTAVLLVLATTLLPAIQLVPLPGPLWQSLPGREIEALALARIGAADSWRPWTISLHLTLNTLLATLPPALLLVLVSQLSPRKRWIVPATIAVAALLSLMIGVLQMVSPLDGPLRFYAPKSPWLHGFQANRNSQADILCIGIIAAAAVAREALERDRLGRTMALTGFAATATALAVGSVLTASRTGVALLLFTLLFSLAMLRTPVRSLLRENSRPAFVIASVAACFAAVALSYAPVDELLNRFDFTDEPRPEIWQVSLRAAAQYWPFGSGAGTFGPVFAQFGQPGAYGSVAIKHAHNEILEFMVEAGVFSLIAAATIAVILLVNARRCLSMGPHPLRTWAIFSAGAVSVVALHSLVDYPLRSLSLACIIGACAGLIVMPRSDRDRLSYRERVAR